MRGFTTKPFCKLLADLRVACSSFFQTGVARLATTSTSTDAYILCHMLLKNPLFTTCKATMAESLAS